MKPSRVLHLVGIVAGLGLGTTACGMWSGSPESGPGSGQGGSSVTATVTRGTFVRTVRVAGTTEAVRSAAAMAPRLQGQQNAPLVITKLIAGGSRVKEGDVLVEFDPQSQIRAAFDRLTEFQDLEQQIRRAEADQALAYAADETAITQANNDVLRARLDVRKNKVLAAIEAEKNNLALEEAEARAAEVRQARELRRETAAAAMKTLQIRRERSARTLEHAELNAQYMVVRAPFEGLIVKQPVFKGSSMTEIQEGDEVRAGVPIVQVVDPSSMQVRARVGQMDATLVAAGQRARVSLDAYPGLGFDATVRQIAPLAITSSVTPAVRGFVAVVSVAGSHASLMPDLSAAVDIVVEEQAGVLILPRDAVVIDEDGAWVRLQQGRSFVRQAVTLGSVSAEQAIVESGVPEGAVVARRAAAVE